MHDASSRSSSPFYNTSLGLTGHLISFLITVYHLLLGAEGTGNEAVTHSDVGFSGRIGPEGECAGIVLAGKYLPFPVIALRHF